MKNLRLIGPEVFSCRFARNFSNTIVVHKLTGRERSVDEAQESQIIAECIRGDENAWSHIVRNYQKLVFNIAYRFCGRYDAAEDMTQEIFVKVFRFLPQFQKQRGEFRSWLCVMARNHLIDNARKSKRGWSQSGGSEEIERLDFSNDETLSPQHQVERQDTARFVHACLQELPPDTRNALVLREIEGLSYEEISSLLKTPLGTVKSRINRGRIELARIVNMRKMSLMPESVRAQERRAYELP